MNGMYTKLFQPVLHREYGGCSLEEEKVSGQKELRIIDSLEPVLNQHKLVIDKALIIADMKRDTDRQLCYQLTRITKERNSLVHDDELEALSGAVRYFIPKMKVDTEDTERQHKEELFDREIEKWLEDYDCLEASSGNYLDNI